MLAIVMLFPVRARVSVRVRGLANPNPNPNPSPSPNPSPNQVYPHSAADFLRALPEFGTILLDHRAMLRKANKVVTLLTQTVDRLSE